MTLSNAIKYYEEENNPMIPIPDVLRQADFCDLYNYFAYEIPFILAWGETQAGNDYFMKKQRGLPADDILQYEAEWDTCFLWNKIHLDAPVRVLTPYEEATAEIEIQEPMPDEPPVPPPRASISTFSYIRGQAPPGTYTCGYLSFAGADPGRSGSGPPTPPQPPVPLSDGHSHGILHHQSHQTHQHPGY